MQITDLLPQDPSFGPPLPRFLNLPWPWLQNSKAVSQTQNNPTFENPRNIFGNPTITSNTPVVVNPPDLTPAYENLEEIELQDIDPELLMPRRIVVHRKYKLRSK